MVPPFADAFKRLRAFGQVPVANIFSDLPQTEESFAMRCFDRFAIYRRTLLSDLVGRLGWCLAGGNGVRIIREVLKK